MAQGMKRIGISIGILVTEGIVVVEQLNNYAKIRLRMYNDLIDFIRRKCEANELRVMVQFNRNKFLELYGYDDTLINRRLLAQVLRIMWAVGFFWRKGRNQYHHRYSITPEACIMVDRITPNLRYFIARGYMPCWLIKKLRGGCENDW